MNQLALARRYRPTSFNTLVGQRVVVRALSNALETKRYHHAYIFTGTRGVGKTTVARILAKCFNCEQGISSQPCGTCHACVAIEAGNYVDFIEVDAASRTKVEDTRELLDNVQYLPTVGRFKIYLIDEVHMLSLHSFNALLKTLEEPPEHVIFLLATTDPEKLPLTILSRCLQFHLGALSFEEISHHLEFVLQSEKIPFAMEALVALSQAADGSLRDALSLLDQAIAYSGSDVTTKAVHQMLGVSETADILALLQALMKGDATELLLHVDKMVEKAPDFGSVLAHMLRVLHQVAIAQETEEALPKHIKERSSIIEIAKSLSKEETQLYYQIGLMGQRDFAYHPHPRIGFEMTLLRMLSFRPLPVADKLYQQETKNTQETRERQETREQQEIKNTPEAISVSWPNILNQLPLSGLCKQFAEHCIFKAWENDTIVLMLNESNRPLWSKRNEERLCELLQAHLKKPVRLKILFNSDNENKSAPSLKESPLEQAQALVIKDPRLQLLMKELDAKVERVERIETK